MNSVLEFTVYVFHWPVPDENPLYKESKHSLNHINVVDLLRSIESAVVCDGLVEDVDLVMSNAADPSETPGPSPTSILRHSVHKSCRANEFFVITRTILNQNLASVKKMLKVFVRKSSLFHQSKDMLQS